MLRGQIGGRTACAGGRRAVVRLQPFRAHSAGAAPLRRRRLTQARAGAASRQQHITIGGELVEIRLAGERDYWPASDLHCKVFHEEDSRGARAGTAQSAGHGMQAAWLRVDRCMALQVNDSLARRGAGRAACLLALASTQSSRPPTLDGDQLPAPLSLLARWVLLPGIRTSIGASASVHGIVGVANVDSFGDLVPPRSLHPWRDGALGWVKREGIAYISNVCITRERRRQGIARALVEEAESLARSWGCTRAALHCNPANTSAQTLYRHLGYRDAVLEPVWMPYLQGRAPDRCMLMIKRLPP